MSARPCEGERLAELLRQVDAARALLAGAVALIEPAVDGCDVDYPAALALVERAQADLLDGAQFARERRGQPGAPCIAVGAP